MSKKYMENSNDSQAKETAEELEAETEQLAEVKEDDIRTQIISDYGFDEDDDKEKIDKLVKKEVDHKKSLSTVIGQKRKYRDLVNKPKETPKTDPPTPKEEKGKDLDKAIAKAIETSKLDDMEYPDDLKKAIAQVAKINEISVRSAVADPYIKAKIELWEKKKEAEESALNRTNKSGKKSSGDDPMMPPDVDMNTKEGRKEYDEWKARAIKEEIKNRG